MNTDDAPSIDIEKLNKMKIEILQLEQENLKTGDRTNDEMIDAIRKIIINTSNKTF